jgi:hypothetical protein
MHLNLMVDKTFRTKFKLGFRIKIKLTSFLNIVFYFLKMNLKKILKRFFEIRINIFKLRRIKCKILFELMSALFIEKIVFFYYLITNYFCQKKEFKTLQKR